MPHRALAATLAALLVAAPASAQVVRGFTSRFSTNDRGDVLPIGNTLMSCTTSGTCTNARNGTGGSVDDNDFTMQYVDVDADASTFCSSRATLAMPAGATVLWAGLYWGGFSANAARNQARFSTPAAGYATVTATQLDASGNAYQGFAIVTAAVAAAGNGTYAVANVQSTTGANNYAGWSLVVVYRDPAVATRNLVVFDGYAEVAPGATVTIPVTGFVTPPAGAVNTRLGVVAYEGDLGLTGDQFLLNGVALGNAANPTTNFFNSSISFGGVGVTTKTPNYVNQLGFDIDQLSLVNAIPNGATGATIALSSVGDRYYPGAVTFVTDLYAPVITGNGFQKRVVDLNGAPARPGDILEYTISLLNTGQDAAVQAVIRDTLPANGAYVPGSITIVSGPNPGAKTDGAGDDQAEYDGAARRIVARVGTGANAASGGTISPGVATSLRFRVTVASPSANGSTVSNQAAANFNGAQFGTSFSARSDGDTTVAGVQPTVTTVTAPVVSGRVFEDVGYGGGAGRSLAASAGVVRPGARVELYASTGAFLAADTTDAAGLFAFDGWAAGSYTVRVVNATVLSSRPGAASSLVAVQTFRTDASAGTAVADPQRVGGEIPARGDAAANTTSLSLAALTTATATAQSIVPVTLGTADVTGVDFGFNFDLIVNANDAGQGSLRQFLLNTNALGNSGLAQVGQSPGVETGIFMVSNGAVHPGLRAGLPNLLSGGVVTIAPLTALPPLTDPATNVDGTTQTTNVGDTNGGAMGTGGTVGVDALSLPTLAKPEVEIRDGAALAIGLDLQGTGESVVGIAITGFGSTPGNDAHANLRIGAAASGARIDRCAIGSSAVAFADPGAAARSGGDGVRALGGDDGVIQSSLIGFATGNGVALTGGSNGWQVIGCEVRGNAIGQGTRDGISIESSGTETIRGNRIEGHTGTGIDARTSTGSLTFENNTVTRNGLGGATAETPGIRVGGASSRLDRNVITDNFGAGVLVNPSANGNTITRNSIAGNGAALDAGGAGPSGQVGIDLQRAGEDESRGTAPFVTLNDLGDVDTGGNGLLNFPVLETAVVANGSITIAGWARPGSAIELFVAAPDPRGFGQGVSWIASLVEGSGSDLDATTSLYSGIVNGLAQGTDLTNRFRFTLATPAGVTLGTRLTATATVSSSTSEFSGLVTVVSGVAVSGLVYDDRDHDSGLDPGEPTSGAVLYAKLVSAASPAVAQSVTGVTPSGTYSFGFVPAGTYSIVLDDNSTPSDLMPAPPPGWIVTESAPGVRSGIAVSSSDVTGQNFGLWHGSRLDGRVHRDDGAAAGVPNDGLQQGGEAGIAGARVRLLSGMCPGGACDSALTSGSGAFTLWLPAAAAGSPAQVVESNPASWVSTGGSPGSTGGTYSRSTDAVDFVAATGRMETGIDFGDVPGNRLAPPGVRGGAAGAVVFHPHTFVAGSVGSVTFSTAATPQPPIPGWSAQLVIDLDCDGAVDPGEPVAAGAVSVAAGQTVCLVLRHGIPVGAPAGAEERLTLTASFAYVNASPALTAAASLEDLTTVMDSGTLEIVKAVDVTSARPGDLITYTITYRNLGPDPLSSIVIRDATPAFTVFDAAGCSGLGAGLAGCAVTGAPAVGGQGGLAWTLSGALAPGGTGAVTFRVRVQ